MTDPFPGRLQAARRGSEEAWAALYKDLAPGVVGYLRAQRAPDPESIAGDVFVEVVRDLHRFEGDRSQFRSWVFGIAHLRLLDVRRKATRRPVETSLPNELSDLGGIGDVEEEALLVLGSRRAVRWLNSLSSDQRDVLLLRILADLSVDQVATILHKRPGAVRVLQHRGLARLRKLMSKGGVTG
jgi:RNA polymerase sigma factor (sigma-70 family)